MQRRDEFLVNLFSDYNLFLLRLTSLPYPPNSQTFIICQTFFLIFSLAMHAAKRARNSRQTNSILFK